MRQYRIYYKCDAAAEFALLEPGAHSGLYDRPEIKAVIAIMRDTPCVEGIAVRLGGELFNVMSFDQPAEAPNSFKFEPTVAGEDFVGRASEL